MTDVQSNQDPQDTMKRLIPASGTVDTPENYYRKELDSYSDWHFAWAREAGQNSIDSGATLINIVTKRGPKYTTKWDSEETGASISWADNGCGMDIDDGEGKIVLFSRFLVLGGSKKKSSNVGGFGWAKKLLAFGMLDYSIDTGRIALNGIGGQWNAEPRRKIVGTILKVNAPADLYDMEEGIKRWAEWTDTGGVQIKLNGKVLKTFDSKTVLSSKNIFDWARISNVKGNGKKIYVRIGGQLMYDFRGPEDLPNPVTLDLLGESTNFFTSNRDSLKSQYRNQIFDWLKKLHKDPKTIEVVDKKKMDFGGTKGFIELDGLDDETRKEDMDKMMKMFMENPEMLAEAMSAKSAAQDKFGKPIYEGFNVSVLNFCDKDIPARFVPGTWTGPSIKLMTIWTSVILLTGDVVGHKGVITPGWHFKPGEEACWDTSGGRYDGNGRMLLNPVSIDVATGKMTNRLDDTRRTFNKLIVTAVHEFCHARGHNYHSNDYVTCYDTFFEMVLEAMDRYEDLWRALRSV